MTHPTTHRRNSAKRPRRLGAVLTAIAMLGAVAIGVTATSSDQASAAEPSSIDFTVT